MSEFEFIACDASAAMSEKAEYVLTLGCAELVLCSHHMREHRTAMALEGWEIALIPALPTAVEESTPVFDMAEAAMSDDCRECDDPPNGWEDRF